MTVDISKEAVEELAVMCGMTGDETVADTLLALSARVEELERALGYFMRDSRFVVSVGGNPNVVTRMLTEVRAILNEP